ncbi:MAG: HDOD domain-containing protein [Azoarcus sp.]|jgi:EAL and modified HD-GYP domain-containing signal transduction protein|nr:HDOD domain-containing protein [Azoarcus sp.]
MLINLLRRLFRRSSSPEKIAERVEAPLQQETSSEDTSGIENIGASIICREAVLNRQQKIVGYQFQLQKTALSRIRVQNRRIFHLYTEILVRNLAQANIFPLLSQRSVFIEVPDSFLGHPCLKLLPAANTFFILKSIDDSSAPSQDELLAWTRELRKLGYRIGIPDPIAMPGYLHLLSEVSLVSLQASTLEIDKGKSLVAGILRKMPQAMILMRDLHSLEDFNFWHEIGATLFQGPFVVSREHWQKADLGSSVTHLAILMKKLQQDAETHEIVSLLKQDAAITLRLLRYINSAANGLRENVTSIEHAITLLGRAPLLRWLTLMLCSSNRNQPRASAVLETALVRARFMELISSSKPKTEREAIFLTGLLSLIDVILQQPIEHALETLSIGDDILFAILHSQGVYAATLALARACEGMDTGRIVSAAEACGIHPEQASACYMDALSWTLTLQQEVQD